MGPAPDHQNCVSITCNSYKDYQFFRDSHHKNKMVLQDLYTVLRQGLAYDMNIGRHEWHRFWRPVAAV